MLLQHEKGRGCPRPDEWVDALVDVLITVELGL
jgi:hypothetical protein